MLQLDPFDQQGDVFLQHTLDGGEVAIKEGLLQMTGGLPTAVYLSLFGGNDDDNALADSTATWWGNVDEKEKDSQYRSLTQFNLNGLPATPASLRQVEAAARQDLAWLLDRRIVSRIDVEAGMPQRNYIKLTVTIEARGVEESFEFVECWKAGGFEPVPVEHVPVWRVLENYYPRLTDDGYIREIEPE